MNLKKENILKVYSGKPGCMCGCQGTYKFPSKAVEVAEKDQGYPVDKDEISDLAVTRMWNRFLRDQKGWQVQLFNDNTGCLYRDTDTRTNVIYFID